MDETTSGQTSSQHCSRGLKTGCMDANRVKMAEATGLQSLASLEYGRVGAEMRRVKYRMLK